MKLDPDQLRAEADAHQARMRSPLWSETAEEDEDWVAKLSVGDVEGSPAREPRASFEPEERGPQRDTAGDLGREDLGDILAQLETIGQTVATLVQAVARVDRRPAAPADGFPGWLQAAAGNPHTYDAPDPDRTTVCVRVLPTTYARLQQAQARLGLRTTAGAWECLLRLGLAAADRLTV